MHRNAQCRAASDPVAQSPCPDPARDAQGAETWLLRFWRLDERVDERPAEEVPCFVDWIDAKAADPDHPASPAARAFLDWQQPAFDFVP
ncbi:hypothetical protein [Paracoccus sp. ME4]|uniref:hypothetical protein n=1 Tax=Paracoccus sp. ME4 TaxID=3138066 RepID=UPI00398AA37E